MTKKHSIVFFGNEQIATGISTDAIVLQSLLSSGYDIKAVVCNKNIIRSRKNKPLEVERIAIDHNLPFLTPNRVMELEDFLRNSNAEAGILIAYGQIIPEKIIRLFPFGIINLHPSILPLHRGSTPIESVILNGETQTGVSIMSLTRKMDAGPIYTQKTLPLHGSESKLELAEKLLSLGCDTLLEILPSILNGTIYASEQDHASATYDTLILKKDGKLDFTKPAITLEREIRAYAGWPKSYTRLGEHDVTITKAHSMHSDFGIPGDIEIIDDKSKKLMIQCNPGYLCIDFIQPAGKKEMPISAFLNGFKVFNA